MGKPRKAAGAAGAITLRNLPAPLARAVRAHAARYHVSLNKAVIQLLEGALGAGARKRPIRDDLSRLAGSLSPEAGRAMERRLAELRRIDPGEWTVFVVAARAAGRGKFGVTRVGE